MSAWPLVRLSDLGTWYGGGTPSKSQPQFWSGGTVPWLSPKDMGADRIVSTKDLITEEAVEQSAVRKVPAGSVAVVMRSGILERTIPIAVVPFETTLNQDMKALSPRDDVLPEWVAWALRGAEHLLLNLCRKAGTTVASLESSRLLDFQLPLPPLAEQRRIVEVLEGHLSHLDAADEATGAALLRLTNLERGLLSRSLAQLKGPVAKVGDLLREPMRNGHSAPASPAGVRTLTLTAVTRARFIDDYTKLTSADEKRVKDLWLEPGDILVQRSNTPELVGTSALYSGPTGWAIFPDLLIRLRPDESRVIGPFLALALSSERVRTELRSKAKGLSGSMPKIDQGAISNLEIPLPTLREQSSLVARFEEAKLSFAGIRAAVMTAERRGRSLRRALLAAAFSGRLTGHASDVDGIEELAST